MPARRPSSPFVLSAFALAGGVALAIRFPPSFDKRSLVFMGFVVLTELLSVELPNGRTFSLGLAPAMAYAFLADRTMQGVTSVALVYLAGATIATGIRLLGRRRTSPSQIPACFLTVILIAVVFDSSYSFGAEWRPFGALSISGLLAVLATIVVVEPTLLLLGDGSPTRHAPAGLLLNTVRTTAPLQIATVSVAALLALAYPTLGAWSIPLFLAPLAATQFAFRQFASIQRTYVQTITALAKVPEMAGYTRPGHSSRVAELSVAMAQDTGVPQERIAEIEYAALLHDIGRIALPDPHSASDATYRLELAMVGSSIVEETGYFPEVARMIREQTEPYCRLGEDLNRGIAPGAKIIKVASAYDDLTRPNGIGLSPWDALERLHAGAAREYDPAVIQALTRVLERRANF